MVMPPFSINWREVAVGVFAFIVVMIGFGVLSAVIRWPSEHDGWPLAVGIAAVVAFLPLMARGFTFLQQSRASFEGPFGIKLNFSAAAAVATIGSAKLPDNLVQPGVVIHESSSKELNEAAVRATEQGVAVVNLEDGRRLVLDAAICLGGDGGFSSRTEVAGVGGPTWGAADASSRLDQAARLRERGYPKRSALSRYLAARAGVSLSSAI